MLSQGSDVTIEATGHLAWKAIEAGELLAKKGISAEIINIHTIKPLDEKSILESVGKTGCIVTAEEHMIFGGLGESVSGMLARTKPVPQEFVGVNDKFGQSGKPDELLDKYNCGTNDVVAAVEKVLKRK
jgi:transketolase